jgi:DNA polymerase-1
VGVAAATYGDPDLVEAYNAGDVYAAAAQRFYAGELSDQERGLGPQEFRAKRPDLREEMKPFVLSVVYGGGPRTIAARFGISEAVAGRRIERFLGLYPRLAAGLEEEAACGSARGYATIASGLRRSIDRSAPEKWTRNVLRNTPVQGGAAIVFKKAVVDLDRAWRGSGVWIVLPLHDGVLIECPAEQIEDVAERAKRVMEDSLRSYYPALQPRVTVNMSHPECWNKDGHADSLEKFIEDPAYSLDDLGERSSIRRGETGS